jgi:hypothetical protein
MEMKKWGLFQFLIYHDLIKKYTIWFVNVGILV